MRQPLPQDTHEHAHTPPPPLHPIAWTDSREYHEDEPGYFPSAPVTPSDPTAPVATMPEPSPIAEHPEHADEPSPVDNLAQQPGRASVPTIRLPKRDSTLPPLPSPSETATVPSTIRDPSAPATPSTVARGPIFAPTPARPRSAMPAVSASVTPVAGPSQRQGQGTSSDESPTEDHVLLQRPAAQPGDRPRVNHRRAVSASHAAHLSDGGLAYPALSYNGSRHKRHDRPDRPSSAALVGVGPGPYPGLSRRSTLDYVVPTMDPEKRGSMVLSDTSARERTVGERLGPTLKHALKERTIAERKAKISGYALNVCIGLQVVLGAITTGVAAASTTSRTSTSVGIPILGGLSTLAASYLARARGSGEPENSIVRAHDLDHFIRDTEAFLLDFGHLTGTQYDRDVQQYRMRFEEIMGHSVGMNNTQTKEQLHMGGPANGWASASADGRPPVSPMSAGQMGHAGQVSPMAQVGPMAQVSPMAQVNQIPPGHMGQAGHTGPVYAGQMPGGQPAPMGYPGYMQGTGQMLPMPVTMPNVGH